MFAVYTIGRCVVLTCSDYFKSTGVLVLQAAAPKGMKKREKKRKSVLCRQREVFKKKKAKKKSLTLKRIDIKDSFRNVLSDTDVLNDDRRRRQVVARGAAAANNMRFMERSKIVRDRPDTSTAAVCKRGAENGVHAFSIINVNDIIRDTDSLLKL